ncbi:hypothetical protein BH18ACI4_BH18ACI4_20160 [soil metagenome]
MLQSNCRTKARSVPKSKLTAVLLLTIINTEILAVSHLKLNDFDAARASAFTPELVNNIPAQKPMDFALRHGDRVVFFGDSITEQRLYTTYVEHYVLTHYPERNITFINSGWGGDQVTSNDCLPCAGTGALARVKRDVIDHRPTVVTLLFGMNDGHYQAFDPALLRVYEGGLSAIIRELKTNTRALIYVMTPTVYDGTFHLPWSKYDRYSDVLDRYSEAAKQIAQREGLSVIDLHAVTREALRQAKQADPAYTFVPDTIHPSEDGHLIMAAEILRSWGASPTGERALKKVSAGENRTTSFIVSAPLPWPIPLPSENLRSVRPELMAIGQVSLRIPGLPSGKYTIDIDGSDGGEYSAEQLGSGIPVSSLSAKAKELSTFVVSLVRQRADVYFTRWRQIALLLAGKYDSAPAAISSLDSLMDDMALRARTLSKPHSYRVVITRR